MIPTRNLQEATRSHDNNFNLVRITLSLLVVFFHAYAVSNLTDPLSAIAPALNVGQLAVGTFFLLSGFFVMQSWLKDPCLWAFLVRRIARVIPGLTVCVLLTAVFAVGFYSPQGVSGLMNSDTWNYIASNSLLHYLKSDIPTSQLIIPGVFADLPNQAMNGSLWSLYWEGKFYVLLALMGAMALTRSVYWFTAMTTLLIVLLPAKPELVRDYIWEFNLLTIFLVGMLLQTVSQFISIRWQHVLAATVFCYLTRWGSAPFSIYLVAGTAALWIGCMHWPWFRYLQRNDYSYSVYIYHWPILQMLKSSFPDLSSLGLFFGVAALLLPISILSWRLIEKPSMQVGRTLCKRFSGLRRAY
jgi:peptidoglycan/LPS O-acetylase OafA/YrhL